MESNHSYVPRENPDGNVHLFYPKDWTFMYKSLVRVPILVVVLRHIIYYSNKNEVEKI